MKTYKIFILICYILIYKFKTILSNDEEGQCSNREDQCAQPKSSYIYTEENNKIFEDISNALENFVGCPKENNCSCYYEQIEHDLKPFKSEKFTKSLLESVADRGTKYQIINHKLYRQKNCMFPARCLGIEHFIKPLLPELSDMEMIINCRDWPQIHRNFLESNLPPVFSFSKTNDYFDIMYPAWSFWEGGPAITSLYPTGLGRWDMHRDKISKSATDWKKKINRGFFRGSRTSDERDSLILLSRNNGNLVDAQYTKNQAWKSPKDTLNAEPAKEVTFEEHCKYKYLFNFRGVAASFRFKHLFLCKSLVFHVGNEWNEFFYNKMKPWVHYIPLKSYPKEEDIEKLIEFFKAHDSLAHDIALRGYEFIWENLKLDHVQCYWNKLLTEYSKLIKYKVKLDKDLIEIL